MTPVGIQETDAAARPSLTYRPDVDGLRAIAVLAVIVYHMGLPRLPGGFVGVDVFFVISGYLITRLIAHELAEERFSLWRFYDRRIRRLLPAFAVMMLVTAAVAVVVLLPRDLARFGSDFAAAALALANYQFARHSDYFDPRADLNPLLHTWSLALEEQFYLVFPLFLWAVWRGGRRLAVVVLCAATVASLGLGVIATAIDPNLAFYMLPTRAWELMLGSLLALGAAPAPRSVSGREIGAGLGLCLIAMALVLLREGMAFPGAAALLPCLGAALVIWAGEGGGQPGKLFRLLSSRPLVFVGLISYSLYLWHWPIIVFAKHLTNGALGLPLQAAILALTFGAAILSWRYVEQPLRRGTIVWPTPRRRFLGLASFVAACLLLGLGLRIGDGLPGRLTPLAASLEAASEDYSPFRRACHADARSLRQLSQSCILGAAVEPEVFIASDSHGVELSAALGAMLAARGKSVRQLTASGCPPAVDFSPPARPLCAAFWRLKLDEIAKEPPKTIILLAFYFHFDKSEERDKFWRGLELTARTLRAAGHRILLLGPIPPHPDGITVPGALARWAQFGRDPAAYTFALDIHAAKGIEARLDHISRSVGAEVVEPMHVLCPALLNCRAYIGGKPLYFDDLHLSVAGAELFVHVALLPALSSLALPAGVESCCLD